MLVQSSIENGRKIKSVAKICSLLMESQSGQDFHYGLVTACWQYYECRDKLRSYHFNCWLAFLNFIADLYSTVGFTYEAISKKRKAADWYRKGIAELEKGMSVNLNSVSPAKLVRAEQLKEKMLRNLQIYKCPKKDYAHSVSNIEEKVSNRTPKPNDSVARSSSAVGRARPKPPIPKVLMTVKNKLNPSVTAKSPSLSPKQPRKPLGQKEKEDSTAKAVAHEADSTFFNMSAAALTSKWVGEAEKLVKTLFDSILCARSENDNEVSRRLKTEFLLQFDGVGSDAEERILVMGATNRPSELIDDAVIRRFPKRIYIGLPDRPARYIVLDKLMRKQKCPLKVTDLTKIVSFTDGYSNSDLTELAKEAAMGPIREVPPEKLKYINSEQMRPILVRDFKDALKRIKASTNREHIKKLEEFARNYGQID